TGGIATGKSTVSQILSERYPIIDADLVARQVLMPGEPAYYAAIETFGEGILQADGRSIDRTKLGEIIFADAKARYRLTNITHPAIRLEMFNKVLEHFLKAEAVVILDTPLLYEARLHRWVHRVLVVFTEEETQLERLMARDTLTPSVARQRIDSQMSITKKRDLADLVINNMGSRQETRRQVEAIARQLRPSRAKTYLIWALFFTPALLLYLVLNTLRLVSKSRLVQKHKRKLK
ncbi:hypothetical protein CXG81DRAFT_10982, partial [Caulochytrium protostelioides]